MKETRYVLTMIPATKGKFSEPLVGMRRKPWSMADLHQVQQVGPTVRLIMAKVIRHQRGDTEFSVTEIMFDSEVTS